jgi:3-hydroxybutyryl-CoA dehydrogenase
LEEGWAPLSDTEAGHADAQADPPKVIGVIGAGTMGSGIAQLAARAGAQTLLYDPLPEALERGLQRAQAGLDKEAAKGIISAEQAQAAKPRLRTVAEISGLADCELVIEAAPERPELKRELFVALCEVVSEDCVLATNTSSLPVTGIAAAASNPQRVVGMHFFNPAPLMRLVEVIAGVRSCERALSLAHAAGEAMGKTVIRAVDGPGFLVNRCNRPFGLEALRLLAEQIADPPSIDRICRMQGGFRMGPFELSDLVGVDTGFDVSTSFYELSYGEPRWRPSPLQARQVAAGLTGRKSGRGWYVYDGDTPYRAQDPEGPPKADAAEGIVAISGAGAIAEDLRSAAAAAGYEVRHADDPSHGELPVLIVHCDLAGPRAASDRGRWPRAASEGRGGARGAAQAAGGERGPAAQAAGGERRRVAQAAFGGRPPASGRGAPELVLCAGGTLAALDSGGSAAGFHLVGPFARVGLVELTHTDGTSPLATTRAQHFFESLGKHVAWVGDAPGLVLGRIVCQLVNECAFALGEGVGSARDIDQGMVLGLNHPRGPLAWADEIGLDHVLTVLDALHAHYREERYRAAPRLRRLVSEGRLGAQVGAGFFEHGAAS